MRRRYAAAALGVILIVGAKEYAQQPAAAAPEVGGPAYLDPANWGSVHPTETDNIVYATVPHIPNPSAEASPNPGTPNGIVVGGGHGNFPPAENTKGMLLALQFLNTRRHSIAHLPHETILPSRAGSA